MSDKPDYDLTELARQFADLGQTMASPASAGQALDDLVQDHLPAVHEDLNTLSAPAPAPKVAPDDRHPADPLLEDLHQDYLRALVDPLHGGDAQNWAISEAQNMLASADPLEDLKTKVSDTHSLYELLNPLPSMDEVLHQLDGGLGDTKLLDEVRYPSVLHLLAPDPLQVTDTDQDLLAALGSTDLPSLTLKEHHDLSIDSALRSLFADPRGHTT